MVDDEWRKIRTIGQGSATIPSPDIASGNFQGFTDKNGNPVTIYDPSTGDANGLGKTPFLNNMIPSGEITSQSKALLKYLGTSTTPFYSGGKVVANYAYTTSGPQDRQGLAVRGDYIQSQKSQYPSATALATKPSSRLVYWERAARSLPSTSSTWVPTRGPFRPTL